MRAYELLYFINPSLDEEERKAVNDRVVNTIDAIGGTIDSIDEWGKRKLAYEIKDLAEGEYYLVKFQAEPDALSELDRILRITDRIIRFMVTLRVDVDEK